MIRGQTIKIASSIDRKSEWSLMSYDWWITKNSVPYFKEMEIMSCRTRTSIVNQSVKRMYS